MIAYLRGFVRGTVSDGVVLDVGGVGYLVHVSALMVEQLAEQGDGGREEVSVHIATIVREDAITLYGFGTTQQREAFDLLREVKGVGPRLAQAILSTLPINQLVGALQQEDTNALVKVPGVGRKTAGRLVLELKSKIPAHFQVDDVVSGGSAPSRKAAPSDPLPLALAQLGYRKSEIDEVLASPDVPDMDDAPVEQRLAAALRVFSPKR